MLGFRGLALVLLCILPVYLGVSYAFFSLNFAYLSKKKKNCSIFLDHMLCTEFLLSGLIRLIY
jgi:hypothetical protein